MTDKLIQRAVDLISIPSETPFGENINEKFEYCEQALDYLEDILKAMNAKTQRMVFEGGHPKWPYPVPNLYAEIEIGKYKESDPFLVYMGHIDVVPVGDLSQWKHSPFDASICHGFIYGRGATDMKTSVTTFITSAEQAIKDKTLEGKNLKIGFIITGDEEWAAINGSKKVLEFMKNNDKNPTAFIVGEPSSPDYLKDYIKVGRRGSLIGSLKVTGIQGHRAYKELYSNPNRPLNFALNLLNSIQWNDGNEYLPNTDFEVVALDAGSENATAIIPSQAKATWGIRYTDKTSAEELEVTLNNALNNIPDYLKNHPDYEIYKEFKENNKIELVCNLSTASIPYFSVPNKLAYSAKKAMQSVLTHTPIFDSSGGTTDARFVHSFYPNAEIIELGVPEKGGIVDGKTPTSYGTQGGMHQVNESVAIQDVYDLAKIYQKTLEIYAKED